MDDFVVTGSDSDASYSNRKNKNKGRSRSYRNESWDSEVTSDESYTKKRSTKKVKPARHKKSKSSKKPKSKRYSDDSDVEFESASVNKKNILDEREDIQGPRRTRGKRTKYNLILDDSSESEAERAKGTGKQIKNCIDSTEEEYDAKEEDDLSEEDPDEFIDDEDDSKEKSENDSKEKSENDGGDIDDQVQINNERTLTQI